MDNRALRALTARRTLHPAADGSFYRGVSIYRFTPTNLPTWRQAGVIEPIIMRLTRELPATFVKLEVKRFAAVTLKPVTCTPPMVYGVTHTPRARMRHDSIITGRPMRTARYERIG